MSKEIPGGDSDVVAEVMADAVKKIAALIEAKFLDTFEIKFEVDGKKYELKLSNQK